MMRLVLAFALVVTGCAGAANERAPTRDSAPAPTEEPRFPLYLDQTYSDGTVSLRYPNGWTRNTTRTFGQVFSATTSAYAAFVGIRYLPSRAWRTPREFADVAARTLRPPDGAGIDVRFTQAARIGGRSGTQALVVWEVDGRPYALMRLVGIELASGEAALIVFATESDEAHAATFGWIKKSISWE